MTIYKQLKAIQNDPNYSESIDNELYIKYQELLMELSPRQLYYWKNQEQLSRDNREAYQNKQDKPIRSYNKTGIIVLVKRSDFPAGPEGDILYKKAYQKEWWKANSKQKTSSTTYCRKYTKTAAWNKRQAARQSVSNKKKEDNAFVLKAFKLYTNKGQRSLWTVEGGAVNELHRVENNYDRLDNRLLYIPKYTLSTFYEALKPAGGFADDGELRALVKENRWNIEESLYNRLCNLFEETYTNTADSCVMIDVYKSGEPLGEGVRNEINVMRDKRQALRLQLSELLKEMKRECKRILKENKELAQGSEDQQLFFLQPAFLLYCLRSGVAAANYYERKEMYLYYKLHRYSTYKRAQKQEARLTEQNRKEQFKRLDKELTEKGMTSNEYWTRSNEYGITTVDIEGQEKSTTIEALKEEHLNRQNKLSKEQKLERLRNGQGV